MKKMLTILYLALLGIGLVVAYDHTFEEAKQLIDSGIDCDELTEGQLEAIGDYYMEQIHQGEAHEMMDKMMGGEGSESLRQMHIVMAKRLYCDEAVGTMGQGGVMSMMGPGMIGMMGASGVQGMMGGFGGMGPGMMGLGYGWGWGFPNVLSIVLLIGLIILVYLWIIRLWREMKHKGSRR